MTTETKSYKLTIENINLIEGCEHEILFQTTIDTKRSILNYLSSTSTLASLFRNNNVQIPKGIYLGGIIDIYDERDEPYVTIGHEGDESGNIKSVHQLDIYWEEVAF